MHLLIVALVQIVGLLVLLVVLRIGVPLFQALRSFYFALGFDTRLTRRLPLLLGLSLLVFLVCGAYLEWCRRAFEASQVSALNTLLRTMNAQPDRGDLCTPAVRIPAWMMDDATVIFTLAELEAFAPTTAAMPDSESLPPGTPTTASTDRTPLSAGAMDRTLLALQRARSVSHHADFLSHIHTIESQIASLANALAECPVYSLGTDEIAVDLTHLQQPLIELRSSESTLDQFAIAFAIDTELSHITDWLTTVREMPVINGDARGTLPSGGTPVRFCEPEEPLPPTSTMYTKAGTAGSGGLGQMVGTGRADFTLLTRQDGPHVFARLVGPVDDVWRGFIRAGDSIDVTLPAGEYSLRYAGGLTWYGNKFLFGPATQFSQADRMISLSYRYHTTVELAPRVGGNLPETAIDANNF